MESMVSQSKEVLLATRVTPHIKDLVQSAAYREGLYVSQWLRLLIINELKRRNMLDK